MTDPKDTPERTHIDFDDQETGVIHTIAKWHRARCAATGRDVPPDDLRCVLAVAMDTLMTAIALDQAQREAEGDDVGGADPPPGPVH